MINSRRLVGATVLLFALMFVPQALAQEGTPTVPPATTPVPTVAATTAPTTAAPTVAPTIAPTTAATAAVAVPPPTTIAPTATPVNADVTIDGSAIMQPILRQAADDFIAKNAGLKLDIQVSGTDGGFEKFCAGNLDINMATKGITDAQAAACTAKCATSRVLPTPALSETTAMTRIFVLARMARAGSRATPR